MAPSPFTLIMSIIFLVLLAPLVGATPLAITPRDDYPRSTPHNELETWALFLIIVGSIAGGFLVGYIIYKCFKRCVFTIRHPNYIIYEDEHGNVAYISRDPQEFTSIPLDELRRQARSQFQQGTQRVEGFRRQARSQFQQGLQKAEEARARAEARRRYGTNSREQQEIFDRIRWEFFAQQSGSGSGLASPNSESSSLSSSSESSWAGSTPPSSFTYISPPLVHPSPLNSPIPTEGPFMSGALPAPPKPAYIARYWGGDDEGTIYVNR
ncbi:hypothetical protein OQA88_3380 [Cercophora sp. LCS_1]